MERLNREGRNGSHPAEFLRRWEDLRERSPHTRGAQTMRMGRGEKVEDSRVVTY